MIEHILNQNPLLFNGIVIILSLAIVSKSADLLVNSISNYARKIGISDYLIGFLVVSIGTATPELIAAITGAIINQGAIVFGTILGSNLFKIPLLGLVLLIAVRIRTQQNTGGNAPIVTFFLVILPLFLVVDGNLSRPEGIVLIIAFFLYITKLWQSEGELGKIKKDISIRKIWKDAIIFILSLAALLLSARWLVLSSVEISKILGISPFFIGLIVIGIGASTPELTVQVKSIIRHHKNIAFGNVLGSLVANSAFVLGIVAIIKPITINPSIIITTSIFMSIGLLYILLIMGKRYVNWKQGLFLIMLYVLFLLTESIL